MLPGFRFLCAAIVLSVSMMVFGLGAAAFMRAAHQQFATLPLVRAPGAQFARQSEPAPVLAMLRIDAAVAEPASPEPASPEPPASIAMPAAEPVVEVTAATPEPDKIAVATASDAATHAVEPPEQQSPDTPAPGATSSEPASAAVTNTAVQVASAEPVAPAASEPLAPSTPLAAFPAPESKKIADASASAAPAKPDARGKTVAVAENKAGKADVKKPVHAKRKVVRRRHAKRLPPPKQPDPSNPFAPFGNNP
jgi:hypothetical protein